jgi:hypothetical protein
MTDKIEIPEEVRETLKYKIDAYSISNLTVAERFLWDLIQKQDNEKINIIIP